MIGSESAVHGANQFAKSSTNPVDRFRASVLCYAQRHTMQPPDQVLPSYQQSDWFGWRNRALHSEQNWIIPHSRTGQHPTAQRLTPDYTPEHKGTLCNAVLLAPMGAGMSPELRAQRWWWQQPTQHGKPATALCRQLVVETADAYQSAFAVCMADHSAMSHAADTSLHMDYLHAPANEAAHISRNCLDCISVILASIGLLCRPVQCHA